MAPTEALNAAALAWEQAYDRAGGYAGLAEDRPKVAGHAKAIEIVEVHVPVSELPLDAVDKLLAERTSPVDRARAALHRAAFDPDVYPGLVRHIAKEICEAEQAMLKGSLAIIRETFGTPAAKASGQ